MHEPGGRAESDFDIFSFKILQMIIESKHIFYSRTSICLGRKIYIYISCFATILDEDKDKKKKQSLTTKLIHKKLKLPLLLKKNC